MSRRTPSSTNRSSGNAVSSNTNSNNNTQQQQQKQRPAPHSDNDYDLLAKITKDPYYVARLKGTDAPPPPSATSAFSAPFTRNDGFGGAPTVGGTGGGGAGGAVFAPRGATNALGLGGGGGSGGVARLWDNHYTQERIPQYDAVNDRYCKFNLKKRAESVGSAGGGGAANNTNRKTASSGGMRQGLLGQQQQGVFSNSAMAVGSAPQRLAPLSSRGVSPMYNTIGGGTNTGRLGGGGGSLTPSPDGGLMPMQTVMGDTNNNNNNNNNLATTAMSSSGDSIETLFQKSRYRLVALWEELGTPEAQRAPLAPAMTLLPGQTPSVESIRIMTNEIQRLVDLRNAAVEVEKGIELREGFLYLLQELSERYASQSSGGTAASSSSSSAAAAGDRDRAYRELVALVSPFRNASLQVVEAIGRWRDVYSLGGTMSTAPATSSSATAGGGDNAGGGPAATSTTTTRTNALSNAAAAATPYMWKGVSYLHKMNGDTYFLIHSRLGALLEYEVRGNPLLDPRKVRLSSDGSTPALPPVRLKNPVGGVAGGGGGPAGAAGSSVAVPFGRLSRAEQVLTEEAQRQALLRDLNGAVPRDAYGRPITLSSAEEAEMIRRRAAGEDERAIGTLRDESQWLSHYNNNNSNSNSNNNNTNTSYNNNNANLANNNNTRGGSAGNNGALTKLSPIEIQNTAATNIQRMYKGHLARRFVEAKREQVGGATRIQRFVRRVLAKQELAKRRQRVEAARTIQALQRGVATRNRIAKVRRAHDAATLIQKVFRGYVTRKYTDMIRYLNVCATKIQSTWRSYFVRQAVRSEIGYVKHQAATKIQSIWRGHRVRGIARYNPAKVRRVVKLQAWFRGILDRRRVRELIVRRYAATRIQSVFRMTLAKARCKKIRAAREDASWELYLGVATTAATRIQSAYRMLAAKRRVKALRERQRILSDHATADKALEEQMHTQEEIAARHRAATKIAALARGRAARQRVAMLRYLIASTITMQRVVRGHLGRLRAAEQRAVLVSYMEAQRGVPADKSKILPATSFIAEALSILEVEKKESAGDHSTAPADEEDETLDNVSAVVAAASPSGADEKKDRRAAPTHFYDATAATANDANSPTAQPKNESLTTEATHIIDSSSTTLQPQHASANASAAPSSVIHHHHHQQQKEEEEKAPCPISDAPLSAAAAAAATTTSPFVVVTMAVDPADFSHRHFCSTIARRMNTILSARTAGSPSSPSAVAAAATAATTFAASAPTTNILPANVSILHVYKGSTNVCMAFIDVVLEGVVSATSASSSSSILLGLLLDDYKAKANIYRDTSAIIGIKRGIAAVDLAKPAANDLKPLGQSPYTTPTTRSPMKSSLSPSPFPIALYTPPRAEAGDEGSHTANTADGTAATTPLNSSRRRKSVAIDVPANDHSHDMAPPTSSGPDTRPGSAAAAAVHPPLGMATLGLALKANNSTTVRSALKSPRVSVVASNDGGAVNNTNTTSENDMEEHNRLAAEQSTTVVVNVSNASCAGACDGEGEEEGYNSSRTGTSSTANTPHRDSSSRAHHVRLAAEVIEKENLLDAGDAEMSTAAADSSRQSSKKKVSVVEGCAAGGDDDANADEDDADDDGEPVEITADLDEKELIHKALARNAGHGGSSGALRRNNQPHHHSAPIDDVTDDYRPPTPIKRSLSAAGRAELSAAAATAADDPIAAAAAARRIQRFMGANLRRQQAKRTVSEKKKHDRNHRENTVRFAQTQEEEQAVSVIAAILFKGAFARRVDKKKRLLVKESLAIRAKKLSIDQERDTAAKIITQFLRVFGAVRERRLAKAKRVAEMEAMAVRQERKWEAVVKAEAEAEEAAEEEAKRLTAAAAAAAAAAAEAASLKAVEETKAKATTTTAAATPIAPSSSSPCGADTTAAIAFRPPSALLEIQELQRLQQEEKKAEEEEERRAEKEAISHPSEVAAETPVALATAAATQVERAPETTAATTTTPPASSNTTTDTATAADDAARPCSAVEEINELKRLMSAERRAEENEKQHEKEEEQTEKEAREAEKEMISSSPPAAATTPPPVAVAPTPSEEVADLVDGVISSVVAVAAATSCAAEDEGSALPAPLREYDSAVTSFVKKTLEKVVAVADGTAADDTNNSSTANADAADAHADADNDDDDENLQPTPPQQPSLAVNPPPATRSPAPSSPATLPAAATTTAPTKTNTIPTRSVAAAPKVNPSAVANTVAAAKKSQQQSTTRPTTPAEGGLDPVAASNDVGNHTPTRTTATAAVLPDSSHHHYSHDTATPPFVATAATTGGTYVTGSRPTSAIKALRSANAVSGTPTPSGSRPTSGGNGVTHNGIGRLPVEDLLESCNNSEPCSRPVTSTSTSVSRKPSARASRAVAAVATATGDAVAVPSSRRGPHPRAAVPTLTEACCQVQALLRYQHSALIAAYWRERLVVSEYNQLREFASARIQRMYRSHVARRVVRERRAMRAMRGAEQKVLEEDLAMEAALKALREAEDDEWRNEIAAIANERAMAIFSVELAERQSRQRLATAATKIQCAWRCYNARFMVQWMRDNRKQKREAKTNAEAFERNSAAALKIQTQVRRRQARQRVGRIRAARVAERNAKAQAEARVHKAAVTIQCLVRSHNARYTANFLREKKREREALLMRKRQEDEAAEVKAILDREHSIVKQKTDAEAATTIQCAWRSYNARFQRRWRQERVDVQRVEAAKAAKEEAERKAREAVAQDAVERNLNLVAPTVAKPAIEAQPLPQ